MKRFTIVVAIVVALLGASQLQAKDVGLGLRDYQPTWDKDNNSLRDVSCTQTAEFGPTITMTVQFQNALQRDIGYKATGFMYFASDAAGDTLVTASNDPDAITVATDGTVALLDAAGARSIYMFRSESDGDLALTVSKTGNYSIYPVFVFPNGKSEICDVLDFD